MEIQGRVGNISGRTAVVVDHRHLVAGQQQFLRLDLLRPVSVHHHQQRAGVGDQQRVLGRDKPARILRAARPAAPIISSAGEAFASRMI